MSNFEALSGDDPWITTPAERGAGQFSLSIEYLGPIVPLNSQIGVLLKKTVPDELRKLLFGQRDPSCGTDASPLRTYAVLNAAKLPYLLTGLLEASGLRHQSLFQGAAQAQLNESAPYLIALSPDSELTRQLTTGREGVNGLWQHELGIFLRSRADFDEVRKHLRKFTRIRDAQAKWFYFAFWDPGCIAWLATQGPPSVLDHLVKSPVIEEVYAFGDEGNVRVARDGAPVTDIPIAPRHLMIDPDTWASLGRFSEKRFFRNLRTVCLTLADGNGARVDAALGLLASEGFRARSVLSVLGQWWSTPEGAEAIRTDWARAELAASRRLPDAIRKDRLRNLFDERAVATVRGGTEN